MYRACSSKLVLESWRSAGPTAEVLKLLVEQGVEARLVSESWSVLLIFVSVHQSMLERGVTLGVF